MSAPVKTPSGGDRVRQALRSLGLAAASLDLETGT